MKRNLLAVIIATVSFSFGHLAAAQAGSTLDHELVMAAWEGDAVKVQQLLEKGANIEATKSGYAALNAAVSKGHIGVVKVLLEKGANIEMQGPFGNTPLMTAAREGNIELVKLLLHRGANLDAKNQKDWGRTALLAAIDGGNSEVVRALLDKGPSADSKNAALLDAARDVVFRGDTRKTEIVKLLLDKGATDVSGQLLENAVSGGATELVEALANKATEKSKAAGLWRAVDKGSAELVSLMLKKGVSAEAKNAALAHAVSVKSNPAILQLLLESGASTETRINGSPLLYYTVHYGTTDIVRLLLEHGANTEATDNDPLLGDTALIYAASQGYTKVTKLLVEHGADLQAQDSLGYTALRRAKLNNFPAVIQVLEEALAKDPRAELAEAVREFRENRYEESPRLKVIRLAVRLKPAPEIPAEARQLFLQASGLIRQSSKPAALATPIRLLDRALDIAPWWGDAYYNLARAYELCEHYDEALQHLKYYLETNPAEAEAAEARAHIAVLQEAASKRENVLAVKYVRGGAARVRYADAPTWWKPPNQKGVQALYTYGLHEEDPYYANVFRMPNNHILAIWLEALSNNGAYAGDQIGVTDITDSSCTYGYSARFDTTDSFSLCGFSYEVSVTNPPNATVTVKDSATGASVTIPIAPLYRARAIKGYWPNNGKVYQGGQGTRLLQFDYSIVEAALDLDVNAMGLTPKSVTPYEKGKD